MYVYIEAEKGLWTVGFYKPSGKWYAESDHDSKEKAAERVVWLNGGRPILSDSVRIERIEKEIAALRKIAT